MLVADAEDTAVLRILVDASETELARVVPFLVLFLLMIFSAGALRPAALAVMFPFVLALMPTLFASFYASYRDIFAIKDTSPTDR